MVIICDTILTREDGHAILALVINHQLIKKYNIVNNDWNSFFNVLHNNASSVGEP